jgi:hypothetical protein
MDETDCDEVKQFWLRGSHYRLDRRQAESPYSVQGPTKYHYAGLRVVVEIDMSVEVHDE